MIKTINLNGREISYDLEYKNVKNINLRIKADQSIYMSANHRVSDKIIEEFAFNNNLDIKRCLIYFI